MVRSDKHNLKIVLFLLNTFKKAISIELEKRSHRLSVLEYNYCNVMTSKNLILLAQDLLHMYVFI